MSTKEILQKTKYANTGYENAAGIYIVLMLHKGYTPEEILERFQCSYSQQD